MSPLARFALLAIAGTCAGSPAAATNTGYRCTDADGAIAFQDRPCRSGQQSRSFEYQREPPPAAVDDAATELAADSLAEEPAPEVRRRREPESMPAPPPPRPPAPSLFRCVRADNEKIYYQETGETRPYLAPAGVVGIPGTPLRDNAQVSAPELNRPPVADGGGASAIAGAYVQVQDRCEPLVPAEACRALRRQLDDNLSRQRSASRDERSGLAVEARALADKLAGC